MTMFYENDKKRWGCGEVGQSLRWRHILQLAWTWMIWWSVLKNHLQCANPFAAWRKNDLYEPSSGSERQSEWKIDIIGVHSHSYDSYVHIYAILVLEQHPSKSYWNEWDPTTGHCGELGGSGDGSRSLDQRQDLDERMCLDSFSGLSPRLPGWCWSGFPPTKGLAVMASNSSLESHWTSFWTFRWIVLEKHLQSSTTSLHRPSESGWEEK